MGSAPARSLGTYVVCLGLSLSSLPTPTFLPSSHSGSLRFFGAAVELQTVCEERWELSQAGLCCWSFIGRLWWHRHIHNGGNWCTLITLLHWGRFCFNFVFVSHHPNPFELIFPMWNHFFPWWPISHPYIHPWASSSCFVLRLTQAGWVGIKEPHQVKHKSRRDSGPLSSFSDFSDTKRKAEVE